jgi:hypothetical protein
MLTEKQKHYKEYQKRWREEHPNYVKEYNKQYCIKNKEKIKEYYKKNIERIKEYDKEKHRRSKERYYKKTKEYRKKHPEVPINSSHKYRSKLKNSDITTKWLRLLWNKTTHCELCGMPLQNHSRYPDGKHLDHIIPIGMSGSHTKNNVRYICASCNLSRPKDGSDNLQLIINFK